MKLLLFAAYVTFFFLNMGENQANADKLEMISIAPDETSSDPGVIYATKKYLFFTAAPMGGKYALYRTDGTEGGTITLTNPNTVDIHKGASMIEYNDVLLFQGAINYLSGYELCKTDGTIEGTVRIKNINTSPDPINPAFERGSYPGSFAIFNNFAYFVATITDNAGDSYRELFRTDGTEEGTTKITDLRGLPGRFRRPYITGLNFFILFASSSYIGEYDGELYQYVPNLGYAMVKNIRPGPEPAIPSNLITLNGKTYFNADDGVHGREFWKTDGTELGTQMVKDITPGSEGTSFNEVIVYNDLLFFTVRDDDELWRSDGTAEGTYRIARTVPSYYTVSSNINGLTIHDGFLYFSAYDGGIQELWRTDGTAEGTERLTSNYLVGIGTDPKDITSCNGRLFFSGVISSMLGRQLLEYNSSEGIIDLFIGIHRFRDFDPIRLTSFKNKLFFSADNGIDGRELWVLTMPKQNSSLPGLLMLLLGDE